MYRSDCWVTGYPKMSCFIFLGTNPYVCVQHFCGDIQYISMIYPILSWYKLADVINIYLWFMIYIYGLYGGVQKYGYPQVIHFNGIFHYQPSILGYTLRPGRSSCRWAASVGKNGDITWGYQFDARNQNWFLNLL